MVSRNWTRAPLSPGVAATLTDDEDAADSRGTFSMGDRVELAVTMENKAKVRVGACAPQVSSLPGLSHDAYLSPLQAKRIVSEKPTTRARSPRAKETSGGGRGRSSPLQVTSSLDSAGKVHPQEGVGTRSPFGVGKETKSGMSLAWANLP